MKTAILLRLRAALAAIIGALFDENSIALLDHTGDTLTDETGA